MSLLAAILLGVVNGLALVAGWGGLWDFLADPMRAWVGAILLLGPSILVTLGPEAGRLRDEDRNRQPLMVLGGLYVVLPLWYALVTGLDRMAIAPRPESEGTRRFGLVLFLLGWGLMILAVAHLRLAYSIYITRRDRHSLIRSGPYRWIRHPIYAGFMLWAIGFSCVFRSWLGLFFAAAAIVGAIRKLRREEAFMRIQFPNEYPAYEAHTWRVLPFIY